MSPEHRSIPGRCPYNWKGGGAHSILPEPLDQTHLEESPWKTRTLLHTQSRQADADELAGNKFGYSLEASMRQSARI